MSTRPILKQFADLRQTDFDEFAVWVSVHIIDYDEEWYDDTDEETFRPWLEVLPVDANQTQFLVRAKFELSDGRTLNGFMSPQDKRESPYLGFMQPSLFLPSGKLESFWEGMFRRPDEEHHQFYEELGGNPASIFPIAFSADNGLAIGITSGLIPGFCWKPKREIEVYH